MVNKKKSLFFILLLSLNTLFAQEVFHHVNNAGIYDFIDELANEKIIDLNSAVKPYSRSLIAEKLQEADQKKDELNIRQKNDLSFFLKDFNKELKLNKTYTKRKDLFYYQDSLFSFTINPVLGGRYYINNISSAYHRWGGAETYGYIGKNLGYYTSLRDNYESLRLSSITYLNQQTGANYKISESGGDYSEMRGGLTYSWKWGSLGLVKDHFVWGNNYNGSNIFSGKTPSFAHLKMHLKPCKWLDFNYVHGWLISNVIDSIQSYNYAYGRRDVFHKKYLAANLLTFTPFSKFNISIGNSIVYSDVGVHPAYLIPFFFYKSVDHTLNGTFGNHNYIGQNSQMFLDISSRQIKHFHVYSSIFVDEISIKRMFDPKTHSNFISYKLGVMLNNMHHSNIFLTIEYTRTNPVVYKHFIPTTTFESNQYNLGHYLKDNAHEIFMMLKWKPIRGWQISTSYLNASAGENYTYTGIGSSGLGLPFQEGIGWRNETIASAIKYELLNDFNISANYSFSNIKGDKANEYTPSLLIGKTNTFTFGINYGF